MKLTPKKSRQKIKNGKKLIPIQVNSCRLKNMVTPDPDMIQGSS